MVERSPEYGASAVQIRLKGKPHSVTITVPQAVVERISRSLTQGFSPSFTHSWVLLFKFLPASLLHANHQRLVLWKGGEWQLPIKGPKPQRGRSQGGGARHERSAAQRA